MNPVGVDDAVHYGRLVSSGNGVQDGEGGGSLVALSSGNKNDDMNMRRNCLI